MTASDRPLILVYGYGNPGRRDDGLGVSFVHELERLGIPNCTFEENYQLNVEDALTISRFDIVIFADASLKGKGFSLTPLLPALEIGFTTHAMRPASVVALCKDLYSVAPQCWLLEIRGYEWEMKEELSEGARENLRRAMDAVVPLLKSAKVEEVRG
ncbi:MAG: hydrogenase maturation protease [Chitinispirillaceae bacterium]|nr:hydrogenase maturation protease [Chitinispirillaceae bacterium]